MATRQDESWDGSDSGVGVDYNSPQTPDNSTRITTQPMPRMPADQNGQQPAPMPNVPVGNSAMPAGIDPNLAAIYQKAGMTPGERGSGFADWQYWQDKPSQWGRLGADLAGTGTDNPEGTPGTGAWSKSGQGQPGAGGGFSPSYGMGGGFLGGMLGGAVNSAQLAGMSPTDIMNAPQKPYQQTAQDSSLFNTLMGRANQSLNVSPDDPVIRGQVDAARAENERGVKNYLSQAAEKGGANANLDAEARSGYEKAGQATSGLQAQLMQHELNSRRSEIQSALQEQGGLLSQQDQMGLQRQLGLIDQALRSQGLNNQYLLGQGQLGLGYAQLGSNNDQFAANYNLNATDRANYWDSLRKGYGV